MKKNLFQALAECSTEEEVKFSFIQFFRRILPKTFKFDNRKNIDFYTQQILFEFKLDANFHNVANRARAFAQSLYYIRRLKFGEDARVPSQFICVVDKNAAALISADALDRYCDKSDRYDWDLAPSTPCKKLRADLAADPYIIDCHVYDFEREHEAFVDVIRQIYMQELKHPGIIKKEINENNFHEIFRNWERDFAESVRNNHKPSEYFLTDIEPGKSSTVEGRTVLFRLSDGVLTEKIMPIDSYKYFWSRHEKVTDVRTMIAIRQKMDRMTELEFRRFTGEFFTPIEHAKKAIEYIGRVIGAEWWKSGDYRLWDMAAGTGNLEFPLPGEALQYCYISTLLDDDASYCKKIYPAATVFQYDFLNDDQQKLPSTLRAELADHNIKWIVFINPPYATSANPERRRDRKNKNAVSVTAIQKLMIKDGMRELSRELSSQFFYRINQEFRERQALIGVFSKIKYINAPYDQTLRDRFFDYKFEGGFVFSSKAFQGTKGQFPVGFLMWDLNKHIPLVDQDIRLDVFNERLEKIGIKKITSVPRGALLNEWIDRPPTIKIFPPMSSALVIGYEHKDRRDRIADGFIASLMSKGNDFSNQNYNALLSGPYVSTCGISITHNNFEQAMIIHAVKRLPRATWLNDKDQFLQPTKELPREFINDCVVWSLFAPSNNTTALANVEYEGEIYQIKNNLYPWTNEEVLNWQCALPEMFYPLMREPDRFGAQWLASAALSTEAQAVLESARTIYKTFYARLNELDRKKFKIDTWDAGWYQVRGALKDAGLLDEKKFRAEFARLGEKLLPQIYELGFLRDEVIYFD